MQSGYEQLQEACRHSQNALVQFQQSGDPRGLDDAQNNLSKAISRVGPGISGLKFKAWNLLGTLRQAWSEFLNPFEYSEYQSDIRLCFENALLLGDGAIAEVELVRALVGQLRCLVAEERFADARGAHLAATQRYTDELGPAALQRLSLESHRIRVFEYGAAHGGLSGFQIDLRHLIEAEIAPQALADFSEGLVDLVRLVSLLHRAIVPGVARSDVETACAVLIRAARDAKDAELESCAQAHRLVCTLLDATRPMTIDELLVVETELESSFAGLSAGRFLEERALAQYGLFRIHCRRIEEYQFGEAALSKAIEISERLRALPGAQHRFFPASDLQSRIAALKARFSKSIQRTTRSDAEPASELDVGTLLRGGLDAVSKVASLRERGRDAEARRVIEGFTEIVLAPLTTKLNSLKVQMEDLAQTGDVRGAMRVREEHDVLERIVRSVKEAAAGEGLDDFTTGLVQSTFQLISDVGDLSRLDHAPAPPPPYAKAAERFFYYYELANPPDGKITPTKRLFHLKKAYNAVVDIPNSPIDPTSACLLAMKGRIARLIAHYANDFSFFDKAIDACVAAKEYLYEKGYISAAVEAANDLVQARMVRDITNNKIISIDQEENEIGNSLKQIDFSMHPALYLETLGIMCKAKIGFAFMKHSDVYIDSSVSSLIDLLSKLMFMVGSCESPSQRLRILQKALPVVEHLPFLYVVKNDFEGFVRSYDRVRAVRLQTTLFEQQQEQDVANLLRAKRIAWEQAALRLDRASLDLVAAHTRGDNRDLKPVSEQMRQSANEAFREYNAAVSRYVTSPSVGGANELLRRVAHTQALCLFTVTDYGSVASVITASSSDGLQCQHIPLRGLTRSNQAAHLNGEAGWIAGQLRFRSNIEAAQSEQIAQAVASEWSRKIDAMRSYTGNVIVQPVCDYLQQTGLWDQIDELLLVPNGYMSLYPFGASLVQVDGGKSKSPLIESKAVSIWPCLSLLLRSSQSSESSVGKRITVSTTDPDFLEALKSVCAEGVPIEMTHAATLSEVEAALAETHAAYFLAHGHWIPEDPNNSAIELCGSKLTLERMRQLEFKSRHIAFLGACESGMIDVEGVPDEHIGLPCAMVEAGFNAIISSQWLAHEDFTIALGARFAHYHEVKGCSVSHAFKDALCDVVGLGRKPCTSHDYSDAFMWAGFSVYGG